MKGISAVLLAIAFALVGPPTVLAGSSEAAAQIIGVGTEAFIVENATKAPLVFDKTVGVLAGSALPRS